MKSFVKDKKLKLKSKILKALLGKWYTSSLVMNNHQFDSDRGLYE